MSSQGICGCQLPLKAQADKVISKFTFFILFLQICVLLTVKPIPFLSILHFSNRWYFFTLIVLWHLHNTNQDYCVPYMASIHTETVILLCSVLLSNN